jgi:hypothetical protein
MTASASAPKPPLNIEFNIEESDISAGGVVGVVGWITPLTDIAMLKVRVETEGAVEAESSRVQEYARVPAGKPLAFHTAVRYQNGRSRVHLWAEATDEEGNSLFARRETYSAIVRGPRAWGGPTDFGALQRRMISEDVDARRLNKVEAEKRLASLHALEGRGEKRPPEFKPAVSAEEERFNIAVGAPAGGYRERPRSAISSMANQVTVQGNFSWSDENGAVHPAFGASIQIWDEDTFFDELITVVPTDFNGNYSVTVSNDDPGGRDIYVVMLAANTLVNTRDAGLFGPTYGHTSGVSGDLPDDSVVNESFTAANTGTGPSVSVFQAATWIAVYFRDFLNGGAGLGSVDVIWPHGGSGSFYDGDVNIGEFERWDWDTVMHEYGHYVQDELNIEDNPGGPHNLGDCISVTGGHDKDEGVRMAWAEGWPTYFGTAGQQRLGIASLNVPRVGDVLYEDMEDGSLSYSLETNNSTGFGEDNEVATQRLLWDLFDNANDSRDTISRSDLDMKNVIDACNCETMSSGWAALRAGQSTQTLLQMGEIASDHRIGPRLIAPAEGAVAGPAQSYSWNRDVGCPTGFLGDTFEVQFFDGDTFAPLLTVGGLGGTSTVLSAGQYNTLVSSGHNVIWAVQGGNTSSPATGGYLGESFNITVNRPPVANAGADKVAECSGHATTAVGLNGTLSSDPDGDSLTYTWSAPGVTFSDNHSATPTGNFPKGTTTVTLLVDDGFATDTDTMQVTVVDTTPPTISCPANVAAECTGDLGVDADDPQLAAFFAGVSATDVCDSTPAITNDAPSFFPVGVTVVTFTATDDDGNPSSCQRTVTVVDTQAPVINVTLNQTSMWPPNHKLVEFNAAVVVTDVCDPNPTFVLKSIVSNEADNGLGDGDAPNDIQGAALGTADTSFRLRAERSGKGNGRIYTITYTGKDSSNNTTDAVVQVTVPKSN